MNNLKIITLTKTLTWLKTTVRRRHQCQLL